MCAVAASLWVMQGIFPNTTAAQQPYTFKVQVRTVYVDVFVTHDGKPLRDLTADNFIVLDNGVRQNVELVDIDTVPTSAMLVLDTSGSVQGEKLRHLRAAAHSFVEGLDEADEVGLVTMTHRVQLLKGLDRDFDETHRAIDGRMGSGSTALLDALFVGLKFLETAEGRPLLLLFTDGVNNASWLLEEDVLNMVETSEAMIFVVGVQSGGRLYAGSQILRGGMPADGFLKQLAEISGGHMEYADSSNRLKDVFLEVLARMDTRYLLSYVPRDITVEGKHRIEVRLKGRKATEVRARSGYFVASEQGRDRH
jgi:VWFA-related protein